MPPDLAQRLADRTLELIDVPSESHDEAALHRHVTDVLREGGVAVQDLGDLCLLAHVGERRADRPLVLLAGHLDTVPAQDNRPGRIGDGWVHGLGAADMKGALATMVELALHPPGPWEGVDVGVLFFPREELPFVDSSLTPLLAREPSLHDVALAIVMEPTANQLHAGCLGNLNATWTFTGRAGHSARPWLADNAIHQAAAGIAALAQVEPVPVDSDGLTFTEVISVTTVHGGIARNVVPGSCVAEVNMRYAPGTSADEAERRLRAICEPFGEVRIDGNAPSAPAALTSDLARRLADGLEVAPKQAWTPVAEFAAVGVPAVNLGPGDPAFAHRADERIEVDALVRCHDVLARFLCG
ncbi:succinyl-diaminopimelate desuccinylase [Conexibacter sp. SYSU D00693]|uniref:succinyl-diaminopimelate desuccinylase n=1 Tax=Conexibacter sp. SYSU D00693 TaxID=2812560 RepID=UPI00196A8857|nr:succinyl-diaminopimelate desuccinylase [Conexibacter sp. SYSU D00693]